MQAEFDKTCKKIGLQLNLDKTMLLKNGWISDAIFRCPIHAQRNEYIGMLQQFISRSGNQHDERPDLRAEQKETSGLGSIKERRGYSEED
ncbi:hypothetical protein RB195_026310 [Necator americanus]|uniref:Reverse transcriptase domain-containing protein n=1 Tax=Necator americanus TaxID=51031 RepID=A0ABR1EYR5_NECAM